MSFRYFIVEDAFFIQDILKNILDASGGFCVGDASEGESAIEKIKQVIPEVVFLDLVLPKKNGVDIIQEIKEFNPGVKIIVITALDDTVVNQYNLDQNVEKIIKKPFSKKEIETIVQDLFKAGREVA